MDNKKLLTVEEFSKSYGIGINKAYEMARIKGFPIIKIGKKILIVSDKVDDFIAKNLGKTF